MACRNAYKKKRVPVQAEAVQAAEKKPVVEEKVVERLFFGVDAAWEAQDLLQNNIDLFEWVVRNKIYPNFIGRNIVGENSLTKEEIRYLHRNVCMIAPTCSCVGAKKTEEQGKLMAMQAAVQALELDIPEGVAIFLELGEEEEASRDFLRGYAKGLLTEGYTPGFKANTDAAFAFDREFSRGMQTDREIFEKCLIWAVAPTVPEYNGMTTTHLIHPDDWKPYAPSGISRKEIAIWQYGKNCHPIEDDSGKVVTFHLDLVRNVDIILDKMF